MIRNMLLTNDGDGARSLASIASSTTDIKCNSCALDINTLPIEAPIPDHLDGGGAAIELDIHRSVLLRTWSIVSL